MEQDPFHGWRIPTALSLYLDWLGLLHLLGRLDCEKELGRLKGVINVLRKGRNAERLV